MDKIEQQMVERFIEMRKQAERTREEADKIDESAADFCYLATLTYPNFLDHVVDIAKTKGSPENLYCDNPAILLTYLLTQRGFSASSIIDKRNMGRKSGETTRHWLERCEKAIAKKRETRQA